MKKKLFKHVLVGDKFLSNGNVCQKVSPKTAVNIQYNRRYYWQQNEIVEVVV